jgi:N utilization substance protein B
MSRRSRAREVVLQLLYQDEFNPVSNELQQVEFIRQRLGPDAVLHRFAGDLLAGVNARRASIDTLLAQKSQRWNLSRMPAVDRNILRLGTFEICWFGTPKAVAIDEAIRLAKRYGSQQSFQFVNGILDRMSPAPIDETTDEVDSH